MISKQHSQLGELVGEKHSVLPWDFPLKSGSWIYFINAGIHLVMCSGKLCRVQDFGDFFPKKTQFWGRHV